MLSKVYISVPISVDWNTVTSFYRKLVNGGFEVSVWDRKSKYDQREFDNSEAVVFLLPNNKFKAMVGELPIGVMSELSRAYAQCKKIYIGYETPAGEFNIYDSDTDGRSIRALKGTANNLLELKKQYRSAEKLFWHGRDGVADWLHEACAEIELPKGPTGFSGRPGIAGVQGFDFDERLLLMM